ncbi:MAG TPA: LamG-like jellyroll fold domain-containing protein, partial [Luteolibacter sp.]
MDSILKNPLRINRLIAAGLLLSSPVHAVLVNRWSFNSSAGNATSGTVIPDPISNQPATVWSGTAAANLASFDGTGLLLPGATTGNQAPANLSAYIDLPNGIVSSKTDFSLEIWATPVSVKNWQRLFDFGRTNLSGNAAAQGAGAAAGEILSTATVAPGTTSSSDDFMLAINRGTTADTQRFAARLNGGTELQSDTGAGLGTSESHFVVTFQDGVGSYGSNGGRMTWYRNGTQVTTLDVNFHLNSIEDVNNWLGRSQFAGDSNANVRYNEVRVYDHAMTPAEISASFNAGADPAAPVAVADAVTMHRGQKARIAVLANDSNVAAVPKIAIE